MKDMSRKITEALAGSLSKINGQFENIVALIRTRSSADAPSTATGQKDRKM